MRGPKNGGRFRDYERDRRKKLEKKQKIKDIIATIIFMGTVIIIFITLAMLEK